MDQERGERDGRGIEEFGRRRWTQLVVGLAWWVALRRLVGWLALQRIALGWRLALGRLALQRVAVRIEQLARERFAQQVFSLEQLAQRRQLRFGRLAIVFEPVVFEPQRQLQEHQPQPLQLVVDPEGRGAQGRQGSRPPADGAEARTQGRVDRGAARGGPLGQVGGRAA
ncbi:MAG: hypothetical protein ACJ760_02405 [Thermoleophilaceae bacterium]